MKRILVVAVMLTPIAVYSVATGEGSGQAAKRAALCHNMRSIKRYADKLYVITLDPNSEYANDAKERVKAKDLIGLYYTNPTRAKRMIQKLAKEIIHLYEYVKDDYSFFTNSFGCDNRTVGEVLNDLANGKFCDIECDRGAIHPVWYIQLAAFEFFEEKGSDCLQAEEAKNLLV